MKKKQAAESDNQEMEPEEENDSTSPILKELGQVFTPPEIAEYLVGRPLVDVLKDNPDPSIVDPACGNGALLMAAFQILCWKKGVKTAEEMSAASRLLNGVELDEDLAQECRDRLADAGADQATIVTADSLTLDYAAAFPATSGRFDIVVSNPPYVRHEMQDRAAMDLLKFTFETYRKTSDLYILFVELGFKIAKEGGRLAYLIPNNWTRAKYGRELRIFLRKKHLEYVVDLEDIPIFTGVTVYPLLLFARNAPAQETMLCATIGRDDLPSYALQVYIYLMALDREPKGDVAHMLLDTFLAERSAGSAEATPPAVEPVTTPVDAEA